MLPRKTCCCMQDYQKQQRPAAQRLHPACCCHHLFINFTALIPLCSMCRRNKSCLLRTLTKVLQAHATAEVYDKLQTLIWYLDIPDPVQQLLPPLSLVSLQHLPVLDLHYYAMAKQAVDTMLSSTAFVSSSSSGTWKTNAAYFFVSVKEVEGLLVGVSVYSVGGGNLAEPSWACRDLQMPTNCSCNTDAGRDLTAVLLNPTDSNVTNSTGSKHSSTSGVVQLPEGVSFWDVAGADCSNGRGLVKGISQHHKCFGCHMAALMAEAVSGIVAGGSHGNASSLRAACGCVEHRAAGYLYEVGVASLWVVYW